METRSRIDIVSLLLYLCIAILGIASVYSATSDQGLYTLLEGRSGKQLMWFGVSIFLGVIIFLLNANFFEVFSWYFYVGLMLLLVAVLFVGAEINGARSWIRIGSFSLQPAEFAKYGTAFAVSALLSSIGFSFSKKGDLIKMAVVILLPMVLIILQGDTGSALVFFSFILVFYREGLTPLILILGLVAILVFVLTLVFGTLYFGVGILLLFLVFFAFTYTNKKFLLPSISIVILAVLFSLSVQFLFNNVLQNHQRKRIEVTLNLIEDNKGAGYNVNQSKIAIGSGGFTGKGFLNGSHTKGDFIPEQETDFIFCTIGEEGGWLASSFTIFLFASFILRLYHLAARAKKKYKRIFIFSLASIIFFHLLINVGMTIGLMPVIGIPLPLVSYGGSSVLAFGIFIFTALRMDATRDEDLISTYE
ncbi:MAG: rod shape-determining protein RodA [Bacteroidetes bacterium]|nr:MAG: rod shape-determining protein RodA [Bacteroidota bacterium]